MFVTRVRSMRALECHGKDRHLTLCTKKSFAERNLEPTQLLDLFPELTTRSAEVAGRDVEIAPSPVDLA